MDSLKYLNMIRFRDEVTRLLLKQIPQSTPVGLKRYQFEDLCHRINDIYVSINNEPFVFNIGDEEHFNESMRILQIPVKMKIKLANLRAEDRFFFSFILDDPIDEYIRKRTEETNKDLIEKPKTVDELKELIDHLSKKNRWNLTLIDNEYIVHQNEIIKKFMEQYGPEYYASLSDDATERLKFDKIMFNYTNSQVKPNYAVDELQKQIDYIKEQNAVCLMASGSLIIMSQDVYAEYLKQMDELVKNKPPLSCYFDASMYFSSKGDDENGSKLSE